MASSAGQGDGTPAALDIVEDGPITIDVISRSGTANPFAITTIGDVASKICLDWKVLIAKQDHDYYHADLDECLSRMPPSRADGVTAFMCFEQDITMVEVMAFVKEFSALDPKYKVLNYDIIQKIHGALCENAKDEDGEDKIPESKLGERLSHLSLEFFLIICHRNIKSDFDEEAIEAEVKKALTMAEIHEEIVSSSKARMLFKHTEINEKGHVGTGFVGFAKMAKETLRNCKQAYSDFEGTIAQLHEAVLGHPIIKAALSKLAATSFMNHYSMDIFMDQINALPETAAIVDLPLGEDELKKLSEIAQRLRKRGLDYSESTKRQKTTNSME